LKNLVYKFFWIEKSYCCTTAGLFRAIGQTVRHNVAIVTAEGTGWLLVGIASYWSRRNKKDVPAEGLGLQTHGLNKGRK
jgi:hypothetical protein